MYVESDEIPSSDAYKAVIDFAIEQEKKKVCIKPGTMHEIFRGEKRIQMPCLGNGWCVSAARVEPPMNFGSMEGKRFADDLGVAVSDKAWTEPHVTIRNVVPCPCRTVDQKQKDAAGLKSILGVDKELVPTVDMEYAHKYFSMKRKSLYVLSNGFEDNALSYYFLQSKRIQLFKGIEFGNYMTKGARGEIDDWKPKGTIAIIGIDKLASSDFMCRVIQYIVDEAVTRKDFRLFVTSKLSYQEFASRYSQNQKDRLQLYNNLKRMHLFESAPKLIKGDNDA